MLNQIVRSYYIYREGERGVGCEHWRDLVLSVEVVLIPRPETEFIVDLVKDIIFNNEGLREGLWADLGTGSGATDIGIGRILGSQGRVIATDLSSVTILVASYNVHRYQLQDKVEIRKKMLVWTIEGKLAGFVSNPLCIPSDDILGLQAKVSKHEPKLALDGGISGMDDLLHLTNGAAFMLKPGGFFAFEDQYSKGSGPSSSSRYQSFSNNDERFSGANGESTDSRTCHSLAKALAEKNMRDLLSHKAQAERNILGSESGWQPISLTDLVSTAAVKKAYRKAILFVHPDKLQQRGASIQQKYTCEKVFDLLKDAWNKFSAEER